MNGHYFKNDPNLKSDSKLIVTKINGKTYRFYTDSGVFSRLQVDYGTMALLKGITVSETSENLLDLGCGYGPIGVVLKKEFPALNVVQTDVNIRAVELCNKNNKLNNVDTTCIESDGFNNITEKFDIVTLNPPIRAGKTVVFKLYKDTYENLNNQGSFWLVIKKKQGALSHKKYLEELFTDVKIVAKNKGYYVIRCVKQV